MKKNENNVLTFGYFPWKYPSKWFKNLRTFFRNVKYAYQRVTRGYADVDLWDFYTYLGNVIADGSRKLADTSCGYPYSLDGDKIIDDPEVWRNYLYKMADHFDACLKHIEDWDDDNAEKERDLALNMLKECFFNLWD